MEQYYNHLTDRLEDLEPFMARTLPKSKEDYLRRVEERSIRDALNNNSLQSYKKEYPLTPCETFPTEGDEIDEERPKYDMTYRTGDNAKAAIAKSVKDYLEVHPEEVIKLRDERLVQEMVDFAERPVAYNNAPTEEEEYVAKREREGRPLITYEEVGKMPDMQGSDWDLDKAFEAMPKEKQEELKEAMRIIGSGAVDNLKAPLEIPIEPSRYMMGNDPYGYNSPKSYISKKNDDGSIEYLRKPEDILGDENEAEFEFSFEKTSRYIVIGIISAAIWAIIWMLFQ